MTVSANGPRVLLVWPGALFGGGGNFGVPQLLSIANALHKRANAQVRVVDLDMERAFGGWSPEREALTNYDVVGLSCYSSYDYLKVQAIAARLRAVLPNVCIVVGGYHPSARPGEFTGEHSPFDYVIVGDGEHALVRLVNLLAAGKRPLGRVLGPESVQLPGEYLPYPWELLERYRPIARQVATQAEIYLSRGCPYDCAFCMERAKRDVSWRALDPLQAVEELHRLDQFLDLSAWTLFIADALFGMKRSFRRTFLEELVRRPIRARKLWLLIRVDIIEREDLELMARANVAPGFGLESGDPEQLALIRKSGKLDSYLDKMLTVSEWARELNVPFGANIIVGHPGETEARMRRSAAYMRKLFLDPRGTHGFLCVDRFRLYPGSPIEQELDTWQKETGMRVHRPEWWHDGDQTFLAEWIDPSDELDFRRTTTLSYELFAPIVREIPNRFAYTGPARDYFLYTQREQVALWTDRERLQQLSMFHLWTNLTEGASAQADAARIHKDNELKDVARRVRTQVLDELQARMPTVNEPLKAESRQAIRTALELVPRERFVALEDMAQSADDIALALTVDRSSTISALHAYLKAYELLELTRGDRLADLGSGTGYGAAVAARIVGYEGSVTCVEFKPELAALARQNLAEYPQVHITVGDAVDPSLWQDANKVYVAFAVERVPPEWLDALPEGGRIVVPVVTGAADQQLTLIVKRSGIVELSETERVHYVCDRRRAERTVVHS